MKCNSLTHTRRYLARYYLKWEKEGKQKQVLISFILQIQTYEFVSISFFKMHFFLPLALNSCVDHFDWSAFFRFDTIRMLEMFIKNIQTFSKEKTYNLFIKWFFLFSVRSYAESSFNCTNKRIFLRINQIKLKQKRKLYQLIVR